MANPVTVRVNNREFAPTLRKYATLTKRTPAEICNRKSYMINRRAVWHTRRADRAKIQHELGGHEATNLVKIKSGKRFSRAKKHATFAFEEGGRLARIVIAQLRQAGRAIPKGSELAALLVKVLKARLRASGFVASGFIEPRERFKAWCRAHGVPIGKAGLPNEGKGGARQVGPTKKGGATPANAGWRARATFFNSADPKRSTKKGAVFTVGEPALAKAFQEETADTISEIANRLKKHARDCGIRTA